MSKKLRALVIALLLTPFFVFAQQATKAGECPGVPGACGYLTNHSAMRSGPNPSPQNGNGTLGMVYTNTACGLNYAIAAKVLGKRFTPQGANQPAAFNITGIPAGACILKAYLWAEGSGDGSAQTASVVNPSSINTNYPMTIVGQGPDKCWSYAGSYTYRADVTPSISGNGNYNISGILTNPPTSGNDMDGATLLVIWSDASQPWRGTIRVDDGAYVVNGGIANYVMSYPAVCGATNTASAFMCVGDIQFNPTSWTLNGTAAPLTWNWWDLVKVNTTVAAAQTTSAFNVNTGGDCFNLCVTGLYYRTTCVACTPTTLAMSSTPATCSGCNGTATVVVSPAGPYTYTWSPSGGSGTTATGLCAGTYTVTAVSGCNTYTASVVVANAGGGLTLTGSQVNVTCFGACNGTATSTVTGGTAPYTFTWSPAHANTTAGATNTASALCAGTYTITCTDANGCTGNRTITITQPPAITATTSQVNITCNGTCNGSASVVASGGNGVYSYAWAPSGGTGATATGLCAGTYTCTISSPAGCSITQSFTITQPPAITVTPSQVNVTCNGSCNGSATVVASGGNGTYTYSWAPSGGTAATASGLCAGSYTCTISSPVGCSITQSFSITQPPIITATQSQVNVTCNGSCNGSATVIASGGTGTYTYAWTPSGGTAATASGLCAGSYTCTISSPSGCSITKSFTITQPPAITATQSQVNVTCNGSCNGSATVVAAGGAGIYTYAWTPSGGTGATASSLCAGTYTCTISSPAGCSIPSVFTITQPPAITATQSQVDVTCNGSCNGSATVVASGGTGTYTYSWAPSGGTGASASGLCAGTYTCTISSPAGCSITKSFTITQPTPVTATSVTTQATCGNPNGSATVTPSGGTPGYTYSWAPSGGTGATATGLSAGSYTCTITDSHGCVITKTVSITNAGSPTATISASTNVTCNGGNNGSATVTASGGAPGYTYAWAPSGGTSATAGTLTAGSYTVTVTDANGCSTIATVTITQPPAITATTSQVNVTCNGSCNGSATVVAAGGTGTYTYTWTPSGGTAPTASSLCAGTYTCTISSPAGCTITKTFTITQPPLVTTTGSQVNVLCNGGSTGSATVVASGGTPGYTYSWAPSGGTGATASGLAAGTYTCTITDANGCTATRSFTITQPTPITATSVTTQATCGNPNGSATVTPAGGTPGYTYSWAPSGGTGSTATGLSAGSYTCTITDANGCVFTKTVSITNAGSPTATISASTNVTCNGGNNGSATVTASGGAPGYTYAWTPIGGTSATTSVLTAGTFTVTVTDANGCTALATVTITQPPVITATTSQVNVSCNGSCNGSATVVASGGTGTYTYSWAPSGGTAATASSLCAGTYTCTINSPAGCSITKSFTITQPSALTSTIAFTPALCNGGSTGSASVAASGGTPGYTYSWAPSGGTGATATGLAAGTYTCTITDANGCVITKTVTVTQPTPVTATATTVQAICGNPNGSATVTPSGGTPGYTYSWTPSGGTGATANGLAAGNYTCTITDANGCIFTQSLTITNAGSPSASITSSTNILCFGGNNGSATVVATGGAPGYTYSWAPSGGTGATASTLIAGSYTVTVTDVNGCNTTASVVLTQPPVLTASASSTPVLCNAGNTGTATAIASGGTPGYTYSWTPSGGTGNSANGLSAATYTCTITDLNGCTTTASTTVTQPTAVTATISTNPVLCNGSSSGSASVIASGGTPGYTYSWAPSGGTGATATGLAAGNYTCTITDANSCSMTISVTVTQPTALSATTTFVQSTCGNANGQASVVASGGTPGYTYSWAPSGGTGSTATGLLAGGYTVTITDVNLCSITASVNVPNAGSPTATITASTNVSCFGGNNGTATVLGSGGTPGYTYLWAPSGGTGSTGTTLIAGSYTVTLTDVNGCSATASVIITQPPVLSATASFTPVLCNAGNTGTATVTGTGGTGTYSYVWAPSGGTGSTASGLIAGSYTCTVTDINGCSATASTTVTEPTQVTTTFSQVDELCNGGNNGSATVVPAGGTGAFIYAWAPSGGNSATASALVAGTYTCTITDANGCFITQSFTITEPTPLVLTTSFVQSTCGNANGQASVVASGATPGYTYAWAPSGGTGATATGLLANTYTVTVTDANGCSANASAIVPNAGTPIATITASTNVSCFGGNNGDATVTVTGAGTPPYNYSWSPSGGTGATGTGLIAGSYTVTVSDVNGCSASDSVVITEPPVLSATASFSPVLCYGGSSGSATVVGTGGTGAYSYTWSPAGGNNQTAPNLVAGSYTCTVTDANGCTTTASTTVTQPTQLSTTFAQVNELCNAGNNGSATVVPAGGTGTYIYSWSPSGGASATASSLFTGTYTCTITDANGCFITQSFTITQPTPVVVSATGIDAHCSQSDGSASANATGGTGVIAYAWSLPATGSSITNIPSGTYTVIATDANNCSDTTSVLINNLNGVSASLGSVTNVACFGGSTGQIIVTQTGGNPVYTYNWMPNITTSDTANAVPAGNYQVTVSDANGCTSTVSVIITQPPLLTISASALPNAVCNGSSVQLNSTPAGGNPALNVIWTPGNLNGNTQTLVPSATTTYTATVTDANGCTANATTNVTVFPMPTAILVADITSGCAPVCVNFSDVSTIAAPASITAWTWDFGDGSPTSSAQNPPQHCYAQPGIYSVTLTVKTADGCTNTITMTNYIDVYANPVAAFGASPQPTTLLDPQVFFTDSSTNASSWLWSFGDILNSSSILQNPSFTYALSDCYTVFLTVTSPDGCIDSVSHPICIGPDATIYVPNAFTPNGDGKNETFYPVALGIDPDQFQMWIFDRWGNMIYFTDDINKGWDGRVQGHSEIAQIDTYVWKIKAVDIVGTKHDLIGRVSLIK